MSKVSSKEFERKKSAQAVGAKVRRKYRAMAKQADRQDKIDRRTAVERGYDAAVATGYARAQAGTCIAAIAGAI